MDSGDKHKIHPYSTALDTIGSAAGKGKSKVNLHSIGRKGGLEKETDSHVYVFFGFFLKLFFYITETLL